ncbi:sulfite exporter TauE/SafE family protein [Desulfovibrio sp.]|uniref:sulfite exporter TauE/SafE family protein n=1 Tax=Desulfovibrio sp. TaxID=885 RepID=UPI0025C315EA|nr:sulfite exporter TauE/SafE family protein [Desulfovibrio sp.]
MYDNRGIDNFTCQHGLRRLPEKRGGHRHRAFLLPALSLILDPFKALAATAPLLLIMDIMAVGCHWKRWIGPPVLTAMTGFSVIGVLCGSLAVPHLPANILKILIGIIGVIYALSNLLPFRGPRYLTSRLPASFAATAMPAYLASFLGGLFNVVNAGSVFYAFSMVHLKLESRVFVATCCALILISNFVRAVGFSLNGMLPPDLIIIALKLIPVIAVFSWLGSRIVARCPPALFRNLVFLLILAMCAKTLSSAF